MALRIEGLLSRWYFRDSDVAPALRLSFEIFLHSDSTDPVVLDPFEFPSGRRLAGYLPALAQARLVGSKEPRRSAVSVEPWSALHCCPNSLGEWHLRTLGGDSGREAHSVKALRLAGGSRIVKD